MFFHFSQSIYRRVQGAGLSSTYLEGVRIRSKIRQLMALALVPKENVCLLFDDLRQ